MSVAKKFKDTKVGEKFHMGLSKVDGVVLMTVLEKVDGSTGKCVEQVGFKNQRLVGGLVKVGGNRTVFVMEVK